MTCERFWEAYCENGLTGDLAGHYESCEACRRKVDLDRALDTAVGNLDDQQPSDAIWDRIAAEMDFGAVADETDIPDATANNDAPAPKTVTFSLTWRRLVMSGAAAIIVASSWLLWQAERMTSQDDITIRTAQTIDDIETIETSYMAAIDRLNTLVEQKKNSIDPELYGLYQNKLALLDDSIAQCREALKNNRYNVQVRTYLALAYKEKADTLNDMLDAADASRGETSL